MSESYFQFKALQNQTALQNMRQLFLSGAYIDGVFQKTFSQQFISDLYFYIENPNNSVKTKFYALSILKDMIAKGDIKIVGLILNSSQFMQLMQTAALKIDPKKPIPEKGKNAFPDDKQKFGNKYVTLILEMIVYLGKKYSKTGKQQPTRFRKVLMKLQSQNVTLPQQFIYFPKLKQKDDSGDLKNKRQGNSQLNSKKQAQKPKEKKSGASFQSSIRFVKSKIEIFIANLQDAQQVQQMQKIITSTHEIFGGELKKFDGLGDSIYEPNLFKSQKQNSQIIEQYLKIRGFLQQQNKSYVKYITKNQFAAYYDEIKIKYEEIFAQNVTKRTPGSGSSKIIQKKSKQLKKTDSQTISNVNPKENYNSKNSNLQNKTNQQYLMQQNQRNPIDSRTSTKLADRKVGSSVGDISLGTAMNSLFDRLQSRSKSPHSGFRQLHVSVEKQKSNIHANPPSRYREPKTSKPLHASNLSRSGFKPSDIFSNPPNPNPPIKNYQGQYIQKNKQLQNILYDIKKQQGHSRFKKANFKNKGLLFENQTIQIGYKSQGIFQQYDGFNVFLSLELYFGNKSQFQIKNMQIKFQGDQNCLIYTNPQKTTPTIDSQCQTKHQLMIIPTRVPYNFTNMRISYKCNQSIIHTTVALPTSILKLTTNVQISKSQFNTYWQSMTTIYKSDNFRLSRHLPPNSLKNYIQNLCQLASYSEFSVQGSIKDYQLYSLVDIYNTYQVLVKINIRPNLNAIIQVGATQPSQDGIKLMRFYLESLQMLLQQTNG